MRELLLLLALVPLAVYHLSNIWSPKRKWLWTGVAFGLVVSPVSMCLLQSTHFPVLGNLIGLVGLILNLIHGPLGYFTVVALGIHEPGLVLSTALFSLINLINGLAWGSFYGILGWNIDLKWPSAVEGRKIFAGSGKKAVAAYKK